MARSACQSRGVATVKDREERRADTLAHVRDPTCVGRSAQAACDRARPKLGRRATDQKLAL
jgi:hypothetical protein